MVSTTPIPGSVVKGVMGVLYNHRVPVTGTTLYRTNLVWREVKLRKDERYKGVKGYFILPQNDFFLHFELRTTEI